MSSRNSWSDVTRDKARASTRHALWILRKALGEKGFLSLDPVELAVDFVRVDVSELRQALATGDLQGARDLAAGSSILEGFGLPGA